MEGVADRNVGLDVDDDDDDAPTLSSQALAALQEFLREQNQNQNESPADQSEVALVTEDWRLSQFWYDRETAETVADEVLALCSGTPSRVACIACPTLYAYLKLTRSLRSVLLLLHVIAKDHLILPFGCSYLTPRAKCDDHFKRIDPCVSVQLLEYDKRFEQYGSDFTFYDYNKPEELPTEMKHAYQVIVADPPYLSGECLEKVAQTISFLLQSNAYLLLLTGEVQKDRAAEVLGLHPCIFWPKNSSKLGNEFCLFTNYDPGTRLGGWEQEK